MDEKYQLLAKEWQKVDESVINSEA